MVRKKRASSRRKKIVRTNRIKKKIQFRTLACGDNRAVSITVPLQKEDIFDVVCEKAMDILIITEDAEINHGLSVILEIVRGEGTDGHISSKYN